MSILTKFRHFITGGDGLINPHVNLTGCTVLVTGANNGLGKFMTEKLINMNPSKVIMAVRSQSKGEAAKADFIQNNPKINPAIIDIWTLDLARFESVKAFARRATTELSRLDVLALNAGVISAPFKKTEDGWEVGIQVNDLSTHYLALKLLPLLQKTAKAHYPLSGSNTLTKPHLTIVSSDQHAHAPLPKTLRSDIGIHEQLNTPESWQNPGDRYHDTKLLEVLFLPGLTELSERKAPGAVNINAANPGFCYSGLADGGTSASTKLWIIINTMKFFFARSTEQGARTLTWAAVSSQKTGGYSTDCTDTVASEWSRSDAGVEASKRVWKETVDILSGIDPSVKQIAAGEF